MVTQDRLKELLTYNPDTGIFTWKVRRNQYAKAGTTAGCSSNKLNRIYICIDGKQYFAHRLAWFYVHGVWPTGVIDHINNNASDNRILNLRDVSQIENSLNIRMQNNNTSGFRGVMWHKGGKKWTAVFKKQYKNLYLGLFVSKHRAAIAYNRSVIKNSSGNNILVLNDIKNGGVFQVQLSNKNESDSL